MTGARRRVLFDINHPAQVHLFRPLVHDLEARGHETLVTSRDKEITTTLLDAYDIPHECLSTEAGGLLATVAEMGVKGVRLYRLARSFDPDVVVARPNPPAIYVANLLGARSLMLRDTVIPSRLLRACYRGLMLPFVDDLCAPEGFETSLTGGRNHTLGFQELAYLHPDRFEPDRDRLERHGVATDEPYFVLRFAAWAAYHDVGGGGWSTAGKRELVDALAEHGTVYVTSEAELPPEFAEHELTVPPHLIHDLLYFATLYAGDSQTMATEAALLGTPVIRVNSKVGDHEMHNFEELERRGLLYSFRDEGRALATARELVTEGAEADWQRRRRELIADEPDVGAFIRDLILDPDAAERNREGQRLTAPSS
jgi:predicted glycosyltransferase